MASIYVDQENLTLPGAHGVGARNRLPSKSGTVAPKAFQANNAPAPLFTPRRALGDVKNVSRQQPSQTPAATKKPSLSLKTPNIPKPLGVRNVENASVRKSSLSKTPGLKKPLQKMLNPGLRPSSSMTPAQMKRKGPKEMEVKVHADRSPLDPDNLPDIETMHICEETDDYSVFAFDERPSDILRNFLTNPFSFMADPTPEPLKFEYEEVRTPIYDNTLDLNLELNLPDLCSDLRPVDLPDLLVYEPLSSSVQDTVKPSLFDLM